MFESRIGPHQRWLAIFPAAIVLIIAGITIGTALTPGLQPKESIFDIYMRMSAREEISADKGSPVILAINEESIDRVGPWPWPRTTLARLAARVEEAGATGIVVTVPVDGTDPYAPELLARLWPETGLVDTPLSEALKALPDSSLELAAALDSQPSAVAVGAYSDPGRRMSTSWVRTEMDGTDWLGWPSERHGATAALPAARMGGTLPGELANVATVSVSALPADPDGVLRRARPLWSDGTRLVPSTFLAGLLPANPEISAEPHNSLSMSAGQPVKILNIGAQRYQLDRSGSVRFYPPRIVNVPEIPAWRVLAGQESWIETLRDRTVFVGETWPGGPVVETPRGKMPAVQFHALMTDQIASGAEAVRPDWSGLAEAAAALLLGVAAIAAFIFLSPVIAISTSVVLSIMIAALYWLLFNNGGILLDPAPVWFAMWGSQGIFALTIFLNSIRRDDKVRAAFHGALPASSMQKLQSRNHYQLLDGVRRQITVLSCSVRLTERTQTSFLEDPDRYIQFRAKTNDRLRQVILNLGGTVDFSEDGRLLGYWNAPEERKDHIEKACSCALMMIENIAVMAEDLQTAGKMAPDTGDQALFEESMLEIGISSDVCYAGPVGRGIRNRYSVIGPGVSYANQLRRRSSLYGPAVITDETVYSNLMHKFAFLDLDFLRVNDNAVPRPVYGLVGNPFLKASKEFRTLSDIQRDLVAAWRTGDLAGAKGHLNALESLPGIHRAYTELYRGRIEQLEADIAQGRTKSGTPNDGEHIIL